MYLILISVSLCIFYFVLFFVSPELFNQERGKIGLSSLFSVTLILLLSFLGYFIAFNISDTELSNRFLHGFGGGFMAFLVCFLIVRDTRLKINKFQFFVLSILIVTASELQMRFSSSFYKIMLALSLQQLLMIRGLI